MAEEITPETNKPFNCIWSHNFTIFSEYWLRKQERQSKAAFQVGLEVAYKELSELHCNLKMIHKLVDYKVETPMSIP